MFSFFLAFDEDTGESGCEQYMLQHGENMLKHGENMVKIELKSPSAAATMKSSHNKNRRTKKV